MSSGILWERCLHRRTWRFACGRQTFSSEDWRLTAGISSEPGAKMDRYFFPTAILLAATACAPTSQDELPVFLRELTEQIEAAPVSDSPGSIWRYSYEGQIVYYVPPFPCCDRFSTLYDPAGVIVCAPDGGITGNGDGNCADFFESRSAEYRVWSDARVAGE